HLEFNIADISPPPAGRGKPRTTRTQPGGLRALSPLIRRWARPLSERQRDAHCGFAYFVGEHAILDRARQHHTTNAQRRNRASPGSGRLSITLQCLLKNIDHDPEHGFKCLPNTVLLAQKVGRKGDQGAGSVDILEMLTRKIVADELSRAVNSTRIDADSVAA